jgi:hypothetical protein
VVTVYNKIPEEEEEEEEEKQTTTTASRGERVCEWVGEREK